SPLISLRPPTSPLFPYTTLFRSHQAFKPTDIGHLVSHGCVRLKLDELYDLIDKIIAARSLPESRQQLEHAKNSKDRFAIKLDVPDRKSIRLNSSHVKISYAVFCL